MRTIAADVVVAWSVKFLLHSNTLYLTSPRLPVAHLMHYCGSTLLTRFRIILGINQHILVVWRSGSIVHRMNEVNLHVRSAR